MSMQEEPSPGPAPEPLARPSAVFFDLIGTLVAAPRGGSPFPPLSPPPLLPGLREAAERLPGVPLFIVTNAQEFAAGATFDDVERCFLAVHDHLGGRITAARCCTHSLAAHCPGHKPAPGLLTALAAAHGIDLARAWYVGDTAADRECAHRAGVAQFHWAQTFFAFWILDFGFWIGPTKSTTSGLPTSERLTLLAIQNPNAQRAPEIQNAEVRLATAADLPAIVRIYNEAIEERISTCDLEPVTVAARRPWFERFDARHPLHVAVVGERVVGWSAVLPYDPKPGYAGVVEHSIYVARGARGAGLGSQLLEHLLHMATGLGHRCLLGRIFRHNEPSLALHRRLGFEEVGILPRAALLDGREADVVFMLRHL